MNAKYLRFRRTYASCKYFEKTPWSIITRRIQLVAKQAKDLYEELVDDPLREFILTSLVRRRSNVMKYKTDIVDDCKVQDFLQQQYSSLSRKCIKDVGYLL